MISGGALLFIMIIVWLYHQEHVADLNNAFHIQEDRFRDIVEENSVKSVVPEEVVEDVEDIVDPREKFAWKGMMVDNHSIDQILWDWEDAKYAEALTLCDKIKLKESYSVITEEINDYSMGSRD